MSMIASVYLQKDVHDHSSGQKEAEKLIADIKTVYRV